MARTYPAKIRELYAIAEMRDGAVYKTEVLKEILWPLFPERVRRLTWEQEREFAARSGGYELASPSTWRPEIEMTQREYDEWFDQVCAVMGWT